MHAMFWFCHDEREGTGNMLLTFRVVAPTVNIGSNCKSLLKFENVVYGIKMQD